MIHFVGGSLDGLVQPVANLPPVYELAGGERYLPRDRRATDEDGAVYYDFESRGKTGGWT
jgi:hypothetical protein